MSVLLKEEYEYELPKMFPVRQIFKDEALQDIAGCVLQELEKEEISEKLHPGMKVAVAVGSRGIANIFTIVKTCVDYLIKKGCKPYIVSAMGSHGGGTEDGQRQVLEEYGISEKNLSIPVITSVDTVLCGFRGKGIPVYFDRAASEADLIIPINRIKLHTDFDGELQSGLCKMLVIGLGNQKGCSIMHETEPEEFAGGLEDAARLILSKMPVGFGIAVMENAYDHTCLIEAIPGEKLIEREKILVKDCISLMPFIRVEEADILIVDEIGKEISGAGYDPNILGRSSMLKVKRLHVPKFERMILLDVTKKSHRNAIGIGQFDFVTQNVADGMDKDTVYVNALAVKCPEDARIPVIARDKDEAIRMALHCCRDIDKKNPRILEIKNTAELDIIWLSKSYEEEVDNNPYLQKL